MARTIHKPMLNETKKSKKARFSINNVIAGIMVITFIGLVIWGFVDQCYKAKNYMDNFYEVVCVIPDQPDAPVPSASRQKKSPAHRTHTFACTHPMPAQNHPIRSVLEADPA